MTRNTANRGVAARAIRVKSQRHKNITTTIAITVRMLVNMLSVDADAKLWIVLLDVAGEVEDGAKAVGVVGRQRKLLQLVVKPHPQIVSDALTQSLREVAGEIARLPRPPPAMSTVAMCGRGDPHLTVRAQRRQQPVDPCVGVAADDLVDDDLQRPGRGQAHQHLHDHRRHDDGQRARRGRSRSAREAGAGRLQSNWLSPAVWRTATVPAELSLAHSTSAVSFAGIFRSAVVAALPR